MQIRPAIAADLELVREIDGTVESTHYLHLEQSGDGLQSGWRLEERPTREKLIEPNRLDDDVYFALKQIVLGADEGLAVTVEHEDQPVALVVATPDSSRGTLRIVDLRVDFDYRRQGMGTALLYHVIQLARDAEFRAIQVEALTNNIPANALLAKCGFELSGVDTRRRSNHDLVKEAVTLFWYVPLD